jgi:hypothetical protein
MKTALVALSLAWLLIGCGSDGIFIISFTAGTIAGDPTCRNNGGQFDLRDQGGLLLLVVITSDTSIILGNGNRGTCQDLVANTHVQVRGPQNGTNITAQTVTVP